MLGLSLILHAGKKVSLLQILPSRLVGLYFGNMVESTLENLEFLEKSGNSKSVWKTWKSQGILMILIIFPGILQFYMVSSRNRVDLSFKNRRAYDFLLILRLAVLSSMIFTNILK